MDRWRPLRGCYVCQGHCRCDNHDARNATETVVADTLNHERAREESTGCPMAGLERLAAGPRELDARLCAVRGARQYAVNHRQDRVVSGSPPGLRLCDRRVRGRVSPARQRHRLAVLRDRPGADPRRVRGRQAQLVLAENPSYGPGWVVLYELGELCWELSWALLAVLVLLFPTGRLLSGLTPDPAQPTAHPPTSRCRAIRASPGLAQGYATTRSIKCISLVSR